MKDINTVKNDFPIFKRIYNGKPLVYLDTAATSQKPYSVIDSQTEYYSLHNANVHRGVHFLSDESTDLYEQARIKVQKFLNAESSTEVIFTKGATEGLNRVAMSYAVSALKEGDSILLLDSEHHSNFVPWQEIANILKLKLIFLPLELDGSLDLKKVEKYFTPGVKIISLAHVSNVLGNIYPIKQLAKLAHSRGAVISVDGAQAVGHIPVDVVSLGCDFYSFSAHKMYGPMGVGALYIKKSLHDLIPPFEFGGGMIRTVSLNS
ncbi:MAG TPA: aminotransferase class V-fold PLP-dependent enzyme, partial [bacterium]|nr:aminotransferase class V-fold PLP-dependent enzyme [bacterium]